MYRVVYLIEYFQTYKQMIFTTEEGFREASSAVVGMSRTPKGNKVSLGEHSGERTPIRARTMK